MCLQLQRFSIVSPAALHLDSCHCESIATSRVSELHGQESTALMPA